MPLSTGIASIGLVAARLEEQKIHYSVTKFATPLALSLITAAPGAFANDAEMAADAVSLAPGRQRGFGSQWQFNGVTSNAQENARC